MTTIKGKGKLANTIGSELPPVPPAPSFCEQIENCPQFQSLEGRVNDLEQAPAGNGDMQKIVYDTNDDGVVDDADNAQNLSGQPASYYLQNLDDVLSRGNSAGGQNITDVNELLAAIVRGVTALQILAGTNLTLSAGDTASILGPTLASILSNEGQVVIDGDRITIQHSGEVRFSASLLDMLGTTRLRNIPAPVSTDEPVRLQELNTAVSAINAAMNTIGRNRGAMDFSTNPLLPAAIRGDRWEASVAGLAGGVLGQPMQVWDELVCLNDSPGGTWAAEGANFYIVQGNTDQATELLLGMLKIATQILTNAETDDTTAITPAKLGAWRLAKLGNVDNTSDVNKPVSNATQTALNGKENSIAAGTTSQYWRGDKSWQTLDKTAVGLGNVTNVEQFPKAGGALTGGAVMADQSISASEVDWATGNVFYKTLSGNTTFTFSNDANGQTIVVSIKQSAGGSNTVTWPVSVLWAGGSTPTQTATANKTDVYTFVKSNGIIYGSVVQNF